MCACNVHVLAFVDGHLLFKKSVKAILENRTVYIRAVVKSTLNNLYTIFLTVNCNEMWIGSLKSVWFRSYLSNNGLFCYILISFHFIVKLREHKIYVWYAARWSLSNTFMSCSIYRVICIYLYIHIYIHIKVDYIYFAVFFMLLETFFETPYIVTLVLYDILRGPLPNFGFLFIFHQIFLKFAHNMWNLTKKQFML